MIFVMAIVIGTLGSLLALSVAYRKLREGQLLVVAEVVEEEEEEGEKVVKEKVEVKEEYEVFISEEVEEKEEIQYGGRVMYEERGEGKIEDEGLWDERRVTVLVAYLERNYWKRTTTSTFESEYSREDLRPVLRISKTGRKIHIVYSKNTVWDLAFSENLQSNKNEKFAFIFKGVKSWAIEETRGRFADVMQDLFEFRAEIRQELANQRADLYGELPDCCRTIQEMGELVSDDDGKIARPKPIMPVCGNPVGHDVVCQSSELQIMDEQNIDFKPTPPEGLELLIPSVCFVIPSKESEVAGQSCGMEVEFKHLLTAWSDKEFETKQELTSSQIMSILKVFKPPNDDNEELPVDEEEMPVNQELPVEEVLHEQLPSPLEDPPIEDEIESDELPVESELKFVTMTPEETLPECSASDNDLTTFANELVLEPLILETLRTDEQILNDIDLIDDVTPPSYVVTDVDIPAKKGDHFDDCYEALLLRDNILCPRDVTEDEPFMSRDRFLEDDISIATVEELLYRLRNIELVLDSCTTNMGGNPLGGNFPGRNDPQHDEILKQLQQELDDELYPQYKQITMATTSDINSDVSRRIGFLIERWNVVTFELSERRRRAAGSIVDDVIIEALTDFLHDVEETLLSQQGITALPEDLDKQHDDLCRLQNGFATYQGGLTALKHSAGENTMQPYQHSGGERVMGIISRWERGYVQMSARMQQLSNVRERVAKFREGLLRETSWLEKVYEKFKRDDNEMFTQSCGGPPAEVHSPQRRPPCKMQNRRTVRLLKEYSRISRKLTRRRRSIQGIFYGAEEFILCSKMYEKDLKDFYSTVNGCHDDTCRYEVERSRDWVANMTLKLSQLYEAVISEVLHRTNVLLSKTAPHDGDGVPLDGGKVAEYDGDDITSDEMDVSDDDGDNPVSARSKPDDESNDEIKDGRCKGDNEVKGADYDGDNSYYWEDEFEDVMKWMEVRELDLANQMPSYKSMAELNAYVSKLQKIRSDIVSNDEKISNTLESFYDTLRKSPRAVADATHNDGGILSKVVPLELRWSKLQWESEGRNARVAALHDVTHNYDNVCQPFLKWLRQAETQAETIAQEWNLIDADDVTTSVDGTTNVIGLSHFERVESIRMRESHFLSDVTHRVEDLRKVNRYGEQLVSLVKEFQTYITDFPDSLSSGVAGTSQIWDLERSLYEINARFRTLQYDLEARQNAHKTFVEKYEKFLGMIETYIGWLSKTDDDLSVVIRQKHDERRQQMARKYDALTFIRHDVENHFSELVSIEIASSALTTLYHSNVNTDVKYSSIVNSPMFWETLTTSLYPRYEKLYDNIRCAESRLHSDLVRTCSIGEAIDILLNRAISVERSMADLGNPSPDSFILSRQVKRTRAATVELDLIRNSMEVARELMAQTPWRSVEEQHEISERFNTLNKLCVELKFDVHYKQDKCIVACLENISSLQHWLSTVVEQNEKSSQNVDIATTKENFSNLSSTMKSRELLFILIEECGRELMLMQLCAHEDDSDEIADLAAAMNDVSNNWQAVSMEMAFLANHVEEVSRRWRVFETIFQPLYKWLDTMEECIGRFCGPSLNVRTLSSQVREHRNLLNEAYSHNGTLEAYTSMVESALYEVYSRYPLTRRTVEESGAHFEPNALELGKVKQIQDRFHGIVSVLECRHVTLKSVLTQVEEYLSAYRTLTTWLKCTAHAQINSTPTQTTLKGALQQFQAAHAYEKDLGRVSEQVEHMLKLGRALVAGKQGGRSDDVTEIKIENEKIRLRWEVICKMAEKNIQLFRSALEKSFVEEHVRITCLLEAKHVHMTWNVLLHADGAGTEPAETYVKELTSELAEYESDVAIFHRASELIRTQCAGSDVRVNLLLHEVCEAWNKIVRYVTTSQFLCDVIMLKTNEEIIDEIRRENEIREAMTEAEENPTEGYVEFTPSISQAQSKDLPGAPRVPHKASFTSSMCSSCDEKSNLNAHLQFGCSKINTLEKYTFLRSTVERHTRVDGSHMCNKPQCKGRLNTEQLITDDRTGVDDTFSTALLPHDVITSALTPDVNEEVVASEEDNVSKIKTTNTRRVERYIVRRKYVDDNGEECIEEREISDNEARKYIGNDGEKEVCDKGVVVWRSPDENESTTTEEEFIRDGEGNVTEWIVRKKTRHTKRTRIVRKTIVRENKTDSDVPVSDVSSEDIIPRDGDMRHRRIVKRPAPPSYTITDESVPSSVTSSPVRVLKRPPIPASFVSIPSTNQPIKLHGHCRYTVSPNNEVTYIIPSNFFQSNDANDDENSDKNVDDFRTLQCVEGLVKNEYNLACPCSNGHPNSNEIWEVSGETNTHSNGSHTNGSHTNGSHTNGSHHHENGPDLHGNSSSYHKNDSKHSNGSDHCSSNGEQHSNGVIHSNGECHSNGHNNNEMISESSLLKALSSDDNYREIEVVGFTENEEREESEFFRFERGQPTTTNCTKIIKRLDDNNNDNDDDNQDAEHVDGEILSPDWLAQQRRKRVKVMIIVSDKTNDVLGQKCRTKYRISPRNSLYTENLLSPLQGDEPEDEKTSQEGEIVVLKVPKHAQNGDQNVAQIGAPNGGLNGTVNGQNGTNGSSQNSRSCSQCKLKKEFNLEPTPDGTALRGVNGASNGAPHGASKGAHNGTHLRVHTVPQSELSVETDENNDGKGEKKRRKSSVVKITVGDHSNKKHSPTSPHSPKKPDGHGSVVVRDRHNRIRSLDIVPNTCDNFTACHPDWKPAMRLLTRNATKILVSHSNRCLVTGVNSNNCLATSATDVCENEQPVADEANTMAWTSET